MTLASPSGVIGSIPGALGGSFPSGVIPMRGLALNCVLVAHRYLCLSTKSLYLHSSGGSFHYTGITRGGRRSSGPTTKASPF